MNTVAVEVQAEFNPRMFFEWFQTDDVNKAMDCVHLVWGQGRSVQFVGPYGTRLLEPPIESVIAQLPECSSTPQPPPSLRLAGYDDSPAAHERRRINRKLP